jgi:murein DD-endopeptidase MepM/ murein hydrolase activator NlpD
MPAAPLLASFNGRRSARRPRTVVVSRRALVVAATGFLLLSGWSGASLWYFLSRDEVALKLLERQATLKRSFEDRIEALRIRLDQVSSQRLVERETLETRLTDLLARQAAFEDRQSVVQSLTERSGIEATGSLGDGSKGGSPRRDTGISAYAPVPMDQPGDLFQLRLRHPEAGPPDRTSDMRSTEQRLDRAAQVLAALEARQVRSLADIHEHADEQAARLQLAIRSVGLDPALLDGAADGSTGGPLIPLTGGAPFESLAMRAQDSVQRLRHLRRATDTLPFAEPFHGELDVSSGFGYRLDPFTRSPALHPGLDLKAEAGSAVRATGAGRVVVAEYSGAYGNMVEIDHGHGVTSRYAHLSAIAVSVGQDVKADKVLGRVGTTGRSTGPHLHYETRLNGDALDPQRFLRAGMQIASATASAR